MSALRQVARGFRNMWGHGDDEDNYEHDDEQNEGDGEDETPAYRETTRETTREVRGESARNDNSRSEKYEKYTSPVASSSQLSHGGNGPTGARKLRSVAMPIRASREKNIYTLKPKTMDEASLAADYLKTGSAIVLNLDEVEKMVAIRIIDFMSGVCYGLDHQGHAMKLGDTIFLFTPGDFEISSDETDYAENREFMFKEVTAALAAQSGEKPTPAISAPQPSVYAAVEPRSWER